MRGCSLSLRRAGEGEHQRPQRIHEAPGYISVTHRFLEVQLFTDYKNGDEINLSTLFNFGKVIFTMYTSRTCKHRPAVRRPRTHFSNAAAGRSSSVSYIYHTNKTRRRAIRSFPKPPPALMVTHFPDNATCIFSELRNVRVASQQVNVNRHPIIHFPISHCRPTIGTTTRVPFGPP